ncbi:MAG: hypothetical protein ACKOZT_00365 [Cyanobium sp.]
MAGSDPGKFRSLALVWGLSLLLSALLAAAGRRWSEPLTPQALTVWSLLLLPPLLTGLWLLRGWRLSAAGDGGQSETPNQEQQ